MLQRMQSGVWKPGELIPSEMELAAQFHVSQGTVRKAVDELGADNLVVRRQGKGTFVATHTESQMQFRFLRLVANEGSPAVDRPAERELLECKKTRATSEMARRLAVRTGGLLLQARSILKFAGCATILEDIWLPGVPFKGLTAEHLANYPGPTYALFEIEFGVHMVRAEEKIRAVSASVAHAAYLGVEVGFPLLSVERTSYTYNDAPMEFRQCFYRTDRHHYRNMLN